jgi:hypothetical protein
MEPNPAPTPCSPLRSAVASVGATIAALAFIGFVRSPPLALTIPAGLLLGAAALVWRRQLGSQLMVRAVLWSNLLLGALLSLAGGSNERIQGGVIALATGTALLVLGRVGLDRPSPAFSPAAFRGALVLALVMALADTQSLALFGVLRLERSHHDEAAPLLACAGLMVAALVGLYRLRLWGLVLNVVANVAIAALALADALEVPRLLAWALATTAVIQLALPVPLVAAMVRGKAPAEGGGGELAGALVTGVIVLLMIAAVAGLAVGGRLVDC